MSTKPRPLGNVARQHVTDAVRAAQEIQRLVQAARNMSAIDRRGIDNSLKEIHIQALTIELELTKARNGGAE